MIDYSERADFYEYEFTTKDDFALLEMLLKRNSGCAIEIPCGSGRLIEVHQTHCCRVYMVDLEPKMVEICRAKIEKLNLSHRIVTSQGDMKEWRSPERADLIIVPRGGLQLLGSIPELQTTLQILHANLKQGGLLYVDVADPWKVCPAAKVSLPDFMRFDGLNFLRGSSTFPIDNEGVLKRSFTSELTDDFVTVRLDFIARLGDREEYRYSQSIRWLRIECDSLAREMRIAGFSVLEMYGNYDREVYSPGKSRIILIACAKEIVE